ncbi:DUF6444 domain-containing protein [Streptosporangium fragile]|uniref:DUF6444 domain-containing protein n=1 Tax=Streptosporangium fragile TaxID=46186 RepID=UPI003CD0557B
MSKTPDRRPSYDELAALVVRQMATIEAQRKTIARLEETVDQLTARVAELERRLGRNSGNSSLPPSSDTFVRPEKKPPVKSVKKRGRQPGAPGAGLAMVETPDQVEEHVPDACGGCGKTLSAADSVGFARRQVRDIVGAENYIRAVQTACEYSWRTPPSRSRLRTLSSAMRVGSVIGSGTARSGAAWFRA